jgi:RimJ/RimL family protein N-acetyltransferase
MQLLPLNTPELINTVAGWLGEPDNYRWLDFGNGVQRVSAPTLMIMAQKDIHVLRVFTADDDRTPIGVVGLSNVDRNFGIANAWIALGNRQFGGKGYPTRATSKLLAFAFGELKLNAVQAWCVECNHASARIIRRLNFQPIGRQRQCHRIDGRIYDRLWFDLLPSEFKEINDE